MERRIWGRGKRENKREMWDSRIGNGHREERKGAG